MKKVYLAKWYFNYNVSDGEIKKSWVNKEEIARQIYEASESAELRDKVTKMDIESRGVFFAIDEDGEQVFVWQSKEVMYLIKQPIVDNKVV